MTEPTEKELAAHVSALFLTEMVQECFTGNVTQLGSVIIEGLQKTEKIEEVFQEVSSLAAQPDGSYAFTSHMQLIHPEKCIRIAELFAQGLESGYGSTEKMLARYEFSRIGKNPLVSSALEHQGAPGLARIVRPTYN